MSTGQRRICLVFLGHRYFVSEIICVESCREIILVILEIKIEALIRDWYLERDLAWEYCEAVWCVWKWESNLYFNGIVWEFYAIGFVMMMSMINRGWGKVLHNAAYFGPGLYLETNDSALRP